MFEFRKYQDGHLEVLELCNNQGTRATFVPGRGGILSGFWVKDVPLLYMDTDTLHDPDKNIRGGNPVLFPVCGPLEDGKYKTADGREFLMKQHGLARDIPWEVTNVICAGDGAEITLTLNGNTKSRESYPFDFRLVFTYVIKDSFITIKQRYCNDSTEEMPFYAGFHPYFYAPGAKACFVWISSETCRNLKTGEEVEFDGKSDLNALPETNLVFSGLSENRVWFDRTDGYRVMVNYDKSFKFVVLWTLKDREFLCLEPWMGINYDMNRNRARIINPGEELKAEVTYSLQPGN